MWVKALGTAVLPCLLIAGPAAAQDQCAVPDYFVAPYYQLPKAAVAVRKSQSLSILVISSAPSQTRIGDKLRSYPSFLEAALKEQLPKHNITVAVHAEARRSIEEIVPALQKIVTARKPDLVIWQTGTVEALRGVGADQYERDLEAGIEHIRKAGADVMLVNPQYSPRMALLTNSPAICDRIRRVAAYADVPLFNRYDLMKHWGENDVFDFTALKNDGSFEKVHRCLGRALAEYISRAASFAEIAKLPQ